MHSFSQTFKALAGRMTILVAGAFFFLPFHLHAQFDLTTRTHEAYDQILNLRFDSAFFLLRQENRENPGNLIPVYLENYTDFFRLFIGEDKLEFEAAKPKKGLRLDQLEQGDRSSPYYRYCQAGILMQWAFIRLKFGEYTTAAFELRKAYNLLEENQALFPDFTPNKLNLGVLHIILGMVPAQYQWLVQIAGMEGDVNMGFSELQEVVNLPPDYPGSWLFTPEAFFYSAVAMANLYFDEERSIEMIDWYMRDQQQGVLAKSPLFLYAQASLLAKAGRNEDVLALLKDYQPARDAYPFLFLYYLKGSAQLQKLDLNAYKSIDQFLDAFNGINYIKSGYQKMAWNFLLLGDTSRYFEEIGYAGTRGSAIVDEDKQAHSEQNVGIIPAVPLLKARLLYDGGYYRAALSVLLDTPLDQYIRSRKDLVEYLYRLGRIYHAMDNLPKAISYYSQTVDKGSKIPHYFAANAALQLGLIHEQSGNIAAADSNYRLCITLKYDEYENSIRQKAKAGLNRIKR